MTVISWGQRKRTAAANQTQKETETISLLTATADAMLASSQPYANVGAHVAARWRRASSGPAISPDWTVGLI